jgi:membrane-bound metal-dependent hydrolase YbcI (DUF457 family)
VSAGGPHLLVGLACGAALAGRVDVDHAPIILATGISALLPDLDHEHSTASKWATQAYGLASVAIATRFGWVEWQRTGNGTLAITIGIATVVALLGMLHYFAPWKLFEHRGPLHWPLTGVSVGVAAAVLFGSQPIGWAVAIGWWSHLVADSPTWAGMPLLGPLSTRMLHVTPERILFVPTRWHSGKAIVEWPLALAALYAALVRIGMLPIPWDHRL